MAEMYCKNLPLSKDLDLQESMHGEDLLSMASSILVQVLCVMIAKLYSFVLYFSFISFFNNKAQKYIGCAKLSYTFGLNWVQVEI